MPDPTMSASNAVVNATSPVAVLLQNLALRYAAGELMREDSVAFEAQLATDQNARDALSEAVRLSAAALGQSPPTPHRSFRLIIRERLAGWRPWWLARQAYRGHPLIWIGLARRQSRFARSSHCRTTAARRKWENRQRRRPRRRSPPNPRTMEPSQSRLLRAAAALETTPINHVSREHATATGETPGGAGESANPSVAEIWANLSTPEHIEKAHEEELRWRKKLQEMGPIHPIKPQTQSSIKE